MPVRSSTLWIHSYIFREGKQRIKNHDYEHFFTFVFTHRETRLSTKWVLVSTLLIYLTYRVESVGNSVQCCVMYSTVLWAVWRVMEMWRPGHPSPSMGKCREMAAPPPPAWVGIVTWPPTHQQQGWPVPAILCRLWYLVVLMACCRK